MDSVEGKGLFVLHEGVGATIFESQVIEHVKFMREKGWAIDILIYETNSKMWKLSLDRSRSIRSTHPSVKLILKRGINIFLPLNELINSVFFLFDLLRLGRKYQFIHARADYSAFICILTRLFHRLPVVWDCRGDSIDELQKAFLRKGRLVYALGKCSLFIEKYKVLFLRRYANSAVFVSEELRKLNCLKNGGTKTEVIPCLVSDSLFFYNEDLRCRTRKQLGFGKDDIVVLYSGSMAAYQSINDNMSIYKELCARSNVKLLVVTKDVTIAQKVLSDLPKEKITIIPAEYHDVNKYCNAADYGLLLRNKDYLNWVASPTKTGEYSLTGLKIIMNDTVDQAMRFSRSIGNYVSISFGELHVCSGSLRQEIANNAVKFYSRKENWSKYNRLYQDCVKSILGTYP